MESCGGKMEFRLSILSDLPQLKRVYRDIVQDMNDKNIRIWDDIYPYKSQLIKKRKNRFLRKYLQ